MRLAYIMPKSRAVLVKRLVIRLRSHMIEPLPTEHRTGSRPNLIFCPKVRWRACAQSPAKKWKSGPNLLNTSNMPKGQHLKKKIQPPTLSPDAYQALIDLRDSEFARRDFRKFMPFVYKILEPQTLYKENIVTAALCEHLQAVSNKQNFRLLVSCPTSVPG